MSNIHMIIDAIAGISDEIIVLQAKIAKSTYPARGQLMAELKDLRTERERLRQMVEGTRTESYISHDG